MGKLSQSYLKELAKKKKFGQNGLSTEENPKPIGEIHITPQTKQVQAEQLKKFQNSYKFMEDYQNSPRYQEMLRNSSRTNQEYNDILNNRNRLLKESYSNFKINEQQPKERPGLGALTDLIFGDVTVYPEGFKEKNLLAHELSHGADRGYYIPKRDKWYIDNTRAKNIFESREYSDWLNRYGIQEKNLSPEALKDLKSSWAPRSETFKSFDIGYVGQPTEVRARLNAIRYGAKQNNLYDPFTEKVTPEIFNTKLKDFNFETDESSDPMKELKKLYSDEEIMQMLNTISKTETPQTQQYAQSGAYISTEGYKRNSPDVNNPYNVIPSNRITMQDVDFPIRAISDAGDERIIYPGEEHLFQGNYVTEFPLKNMGNKRFGQKGFYKPDFRSKSQIAAEQGNTGESTKVAPKINPVDMRKAQEAAMQRAIANQPTFRQGRTLSANEQAENEARLAKIREQQEEEENRRRFTFTGNAEARGAGTLMQPLLDVINPAALYYAGKDITKGLGQAAEGVTNLDLKGRGLDQIGSGLTQAGLNALAVIPTVSELKPAVKEISKYLTTQTALKNAYKLNPNLANPFGFRNIGDQPHWWKGYTQQVTPQNIDLRAGFGEWENAILKNLSKGTYTKEQAKALLSKTPFSKSLGRGAEGTIYEFPNYPEYAIKLGQPNRYGVINEEIIQELAPFAKQGNIAVPLRSSGQIRVPGAVPYQATLMQNLNKVGQPLNLSARDAQALYLKQVRALRDAGYSLDMVNPANVSFNPRKGVYDIFDLSKRPSVAQDPKYLQRAYDFLKSKEGFQSGGTMLAEPDYDIYKAPKQGNYLLPDINRPYYTDEQGGKRSEYKMSFNINGKETLLPTVVGGRQLTPEEAINRYRQTGLHMGQYNTPEEAEYAARLRTAKYNMLQDPARFNASMFQGGGTIGIPGVNGQVVSSGPQPLTSVKKTRGPISKDEKGNVKTMSNKQVKKILKNIK